MTRLSPIARSSVIRSRIKRPEQVVDKMVLVTPHQLPELPIVEEEVVDAVITLVEVPEVRGL